MPGLRICGETIKLRLLDYRLNRPPVSLPARLWAGLNETFQQGKSMGDAVGAFLDSYRLLGLDGSPCSDYDIALMELEANVALPAAYKAYLLIAGRNPPSAWVGSDCSISDLPKLATWAQELLAECNQPALPEQAFVFLMHQGYQFFYFISDGRSDDPPVFYYHEGESETVMKFERFSDLVAVCAGDRHSA